jgi:hypothetical protein
MDFVVTRNYERKRPLNEILDARGYARHYRDVQNYYTG